MIRSDIRVCIDSRLRSNSSLADYGCALNKDILVQGRLYVSENHICFHANIFGWVTDVSSLHVSNPLSDMSGCDLQLLCQTHILLMTLSFPPLPASLLP